MSPTTPPELCEALLSTNEQEAGEADKAAEACGGQAVGEEGAGGPSHGSVTLLEIAAEPTLANFMQATTALCKVILGTTMLVLPKTFELLGCVLGSLLITAVSALTWFTLHGLMHGAAQADRRTYPSLVRALYGRPAYWGLTLAIIANCLGLCLVTVLMLCDCLLGAEPEHSAILQALFPGLDFSAPFLQRPWVLAYVLLAVLTPLSLSRDLTQLSRLAAAGVAGAAAAAQARQAFPLARMKRAIQDTTKMLVAAEATVYLAAVMEYCVGLVLRPACECARAHSMLRITPRHVQLAIRNDEPLNRFLAGAVLAPTAMGATLPSLTSPGLPSLSSFPAPPATALPTEAKAPDAEAVPGLRRALAAAGMERCDEGGAFFANPPQAALAALAAAVAAFEISQDVDEFQDTLTHTVSCFSTSSHF